jgi:hypothetical protein
VHPQVGESAQLPGEVLDVHTGAAVDVRRILAGKQVHAETPVAGCGIGHSRTLVQRSAVPCDTRAT